MTQKTSRRSFFENSGRLGAGAVAAAVAAASASTAESQPQATAQGTSKKKLKIVMRSGWGTDDPTRGSFVFAHALALADAGHDVQIFLLAEATSLLRKSMVNEILPVGWPPLSETLAKVVAKHIPIFS